MEYGCKKIFHDIGDNTTDEFLPGFQQCLSQIKHDDVLVVLHTDRLSRSLDALSNILKQLALKNVRLHSIQEGSQNRVGIEMLASQMKLAAAMAQFELIED